MDHLVPDLMRMSMPEFPLKAVGCLPQVTPVEVRRTADFKTTRQIYTQSAMMCGLVENLNLIARMGH